MSYVSLHTHSEHSELDSTAKIKELFKATKAMGQTALAITDHGSLGGMWKAQQAADANGVKLIPGVEAYLAIGDRFERNSVEVDADFVDDSDDSADLEGAPEDEWGNPILDEEKSKTKTKKYEHLTLIATSELGWKNLVRISNAAQDSKWGKYARIDYALVAEHNEDILILSGCLGGPILGPLARGAFEEAENNLLTMIRTVGRENVYIEVMEHGIEMESAILHHAADLGAKHGVKLVATNDSHHVHADGAEVHDAWLAVSTKAKIADEKRYRFNGTGFHHRSEAEMLALRPEPWWAEAVANTQLVADRVARRCLPNPSPKLPKFQTPVPFKDNRSYYQYRVLKGAVERYGDLSQRPDVRERLNIETQVILNPSEELKAIYPDGVIDYFLTYAQVIDFCERVGILVGPGRGSAAGSLVAYCLRITGICPLENDLLFERFLEKGRPDFPDIDVDFEALERGGILDFLEEVWGKKSVSLIGSFSSAKTKRAIKDAARVLDAGRLGENLAKLVPVEGGNPFTFEQLFDTTVAQSAEFRALFQKSGDMAVKVVELARGFVDTVNGSSIHACGVIVSDLDLTDLIPQRIDSKTGRRISAWDSKDVEKFGLLKIDVLSLRNLDVAKKCISFIYDTTGEVIDFYKIPHPNTKGNPMVTAAYQLIRDGKTSGVFQMESPAMAALARQVQPETLTDLSAVVALFRPGPLSAGMDQHFAKRKNGQEVVDYTMFTADPVETGWLATVLGDTYATFVFQEQLMRLGTVVAGFDAEWRGKLRRAVGKKDAVMMAEVGERFRTNATVEFHDPTTGELISPVFSQSTADRLWEAMKGSASYLFNASHSAAYAQLAYITAYLKANWPAAYGAAILAVTDNDEKRIQALRALPEEGIEVLGPDVNLSRSYSFPEDDTRVRLGLGEVKGVGVTGDLIVKVREQNGEFGSFHAVLDQVRKGGVQESGDNDLGFLPSNHVDALIEAGAFDRFGPRMGLFTVGRIAKLDPKVQVPELEWGYLERSARQRARLLISLGTHPLRLLQKDVQAWRKPGPVNAATGGTFVSGAIPVGLIPDSNGANVTTIGILARYKEKAYRGGRMASITLEGSNADIDGVLWDKTLTDAKNGELIPPLGGLIAITARVNIKEFESEDEEGNTVVSTSKQLTVNSIYKVPVDDPATGQMVSTVPRIDFLHRAASPVQEVTFEETVDPATEVSALTISTVAEIPVTEEQVPVQVTPEASPVVEEFTPLPVPAEWASWAEFAPVPVAVPVVPAATPVAPAFMPATAAAPVHAPESTPEGFAPLSDFDAPDFDEFSYSDVHSPSPAASPFMEAATLAAQVVTAPAGDIHAPAAEAEACGVQELKVPVGTLRKGLPKFGLSGEALKQFNKSNFYPNKWGTFPTHIGTKYTVFDGPDRENVLAVIELVAK